jgi:ABC-type enterochelin transport system substrate-binding protein
MADEKDVKYVEKLITDFTQNIGNNSEEDLEELAKKLTDLVNEVGEVIDGYGKIEDE